jgi:two-component system cell cycle sensor histidine kinase/response regulator CckA
MAKLHVLIIEDSELDSDLLLRTLRQSGYELVDKRVDTANDLQNALRERQWDCIISDFSMPGFSGISALKMVREKDSNVPFIFVSGTIGEDIAVDAMRTGAQDYVLKGNLARLLPAINRELVDVKMRREHKHSEQKLRQLEKFEAIGQLAGGIAHDFNNVIAAIMGWAELGQEEVAEGSRAHKFFGQIREQSERAGRLTRQLLAYARRQVLTPRNINLNDIVGEAMALLQRVIGEQIEVKTLLASDLHTTKADPAQVEQVLLNLCLNARDAMPNGGRLVIETRNTDLDEAYCLGNASVSPGPYVQLSVSDSGVGMDAATMERMFEPFFTTKDKSKGTGLGLATSFGIAKQHLGHIDVSSEVGKGSIFRVYLPATEDSAETRVPIEEAPVRGGTETILLAEDHEGLREMSHEVLTGLGYSIVLARDGREAVEKFEANPQKFSLLVLDVVMPRLGGPDALEQIRGINPTIPVIFTSGYSEESQMLSSLVSSGVAQLLQKPYPPKDLARKIRDILDKCGAKQSSALN